MVDIGEYASLYGEISAPDFNRLEYEAVRIVNANTIGVDGVKKLTLAFPVDEDDAMAVRRCVCKLINLMVQFEEAQKTAASANGYVETENGMRGKVITSVSSGSESVSYYAGSEGVNETIFTKAATDKKYWESLLRDTVKEYLTGVLDANGVNLLYMGRYPRGAYV